jgi:SAM-dependent methyltransferase
MLDKAAAHWQRAYEGGVGNLSWTEAVPEASLALIEEAAMPLDAAILDVGGGASRLAAELLQRGYEDLTVADVSAEAMEYAKAGLGSTGSSVTWVVGDARRHDFGRRFDLWHDRAVFHFMVAREDREGYLEVLARTLRPGGHLILATFGPDGPEQCSGLPVSRYSPESISQTLGTDYQPVSSQLLEHQTPSGRTQQFMYAHLKYLP